MKICHGFQCYDFANSITVSPLNVSRTIWAYYRVNVWVKWVSWNSKSSTSNSLGQLNSLSSIVQIDKNVIWMLFIENKRAYKTISPNPFIIIHISRYFNSLTDTSTPNTRWMCSYIVFMNDFYHKMLHSM